MRLILSFLFPLCFIASCATDKKAAASSTPAKKSMEQQFYGPPIKQNANGEWADDVKRQSTFESNRQSPYFTEKSTIAKSYKTGEYTKTTWVGKKDVPKKSYTGNTDGSRFQTTSNQQGVKAREGNTQASIPDPYKTGTYNTSAANEAQNKHLEKTPDAATDARRRVFPEPEISDWKQQRALDVKTTKSLLGRD